LWLWLRFISILFLLLPALIGLSACAYIKMGPYFHPIYSGVEHHVARRDCCGGTGPEEVLVIGGPKGVQFTLAAWNGEKGIKGLISGVAGKGIFGEIGIYVPTGSVVKFKSNIIVFKNPKAGNEYEFRIEKVEIEETRYRTICPNWLVYVRHSRDENNMKLTPFGWTLQGKGKYGTHMYIDLDTGGMFGNPEEFSIILPPMLVDGVEFQPAEVEFSWSPGKRYLYPFNC
jgi:hypothetical protein